VHADDSFAKTKKDRQIKQGKKKIEKRSDRDIKEENISSGKKRKDLLYAIRLRQLCYLMFLLGARLGLLNKHKRGGVKRLKNITRPNKTRQDMTRQDKI
jgi:hypothetical protein